MPRRKAVKAAGKAAIKDLEVEIVSDDDTSFRSDQKHGFDRKAEERKELDDVITKAQGLAVPSDDRIKEGADTEAIYKNAEAQATASAYMAAVCFRSLTCTHLPALATSDVASR